MSYKPPQYAVCEHCGKSIHRVHYINKGYSSWFDEKGNVCRKMAELPVQHAPAEIAHEHDFANTDTVTVKELRTACSDLASQGLRDLDKVLQKVSQNREPEYEEGAVVRDANGKMWKRQGSAYWVTFGNARLYPLHVPQRPLERM